MTAVEKFFRYYTLEGSPIPALVVLTAVGVCVGMLVARWVSRLMREPGTKRRDVVVLAIVMPLMYGVVFMGIAHWRCQEIVEGGSLAWYPARIFSHLVLITLMIAATGTDLKDYEIPDRITIPGMIFGVAMATLCGNIQILPLWVDWNVPTAMHFGPYIPEWIKQHSHYHGLSWSLAGLLAGGGITWVVRWLAKVTSGQESMGDGDVTLMAMIGSFLGWQPILFAFVFAPVWGLLGAIVSLMVVGRSYVPYGPYLCAGAFTAMMTWRWLWPPVRLIFGHPPTLGLLLGGIFVGMVVLLGLMRVYRAIPVKK
ncbi:MAG: prepilin peptidase [Planctomycetaceae bacterium]|nr:prepilin peptidase [Planctomycetaceae bacterium]